MTKAELQQRIEKLEAELSTVKADLEKCDCADGIEQEKCWHALNSYGEVRTGQQRDRQELSIWRGGCDEYREAYMPECRAVTIEDWGNVIPEGGLSNVELVKRLHKLGFRIKVSP